MAAAILITSARDLAFVFGVSVRTVQRAVSSRRIPVHRIRGPKGPLTVETSDLARVRRELQSTRNRAPRTRAAESEDGAQ